MKNFSPTLLAHLQPQAKIAVLTGAGISAESGLSTFRGPNGLWKNYRPENLATPEAFQRNPKLVWEWYNHRREAVRQHAPNPGHFALAQMEALFKDFALITQNVDGYHRRAGSRAVYELHGNIMKSRCRECHHECEAGKENWREGLAYCACGGLYRPGVVWFGEMLPQHALEQAFVAAENCEVFFSIGTSAVVYPAAALPQVAAERGKYVVEINPEETALTPLANEFLQGKAGEILPALVNYIKQV
ncbi:MAG: NAD-dependent deacylase [candidate division KSB1 bacterium]|nr:NAD-dependent deacylase [candidate division KSB1 bacterium]MDZ7365646.1 NAD-dependent deacylase [candidate division KSB1 bacterium]MDZ7403278.1 NAD-dependent deacylase [candidate division KSB1 bacterium]